MPETVRDWIRAAEDGPVAEQWTLLCFLAGQRVALDEDEVNGGLRRAELLLAAGGNPRRGLELYGRAVSALAIDLDSPTRRAQLDEGLAALGLEVEGLAGASEAVRLLRRDPRHAWQCFALGLLAEHLGDAEPASD